MQLRLYFQILRRTWWLVIGLPLLVAILSTVLALREPPRYQASAQFMVSQEPYVLSEPPRQSPLVGEPLTDFNLLYSWQSTSFIIDDIPQVIASRAFAQDVQQLLATQGYEVGLEQVLGRISAERVHRAVDVRVVSGDAVLAEAMARATVQVMQEQGLRYWNREDGETSGLRIGVLDPGSPAVPVGGVSGLIVNVGLRTVLALGAAVGLAFLVYYLDDRLHDSGQAEAWLGVPVVGTIPKE